MKTARASRHSPEPNPAQEAPMRDSEDPSTTPPRNAFAEEFLNRFEQEDEPPSAAEADVAGPWEVQPFPLADGHEAFGLWRLGERPDWGDAPAGLFRDHGTAVHSPAPPWLRRGTSTSRLLGRCFATRSANSGGVTGSRSPAMSSTGTSEWTGVWRLAGISPRGQTLQTSFCWRMR